ncbi:MAG: hypothetical protein PF638_09940 [Candidatus Delongbacteria bacterium]|nr:hypothetical protein [Candidatus Delongbacteria bacterium]
MKRTLVFMMIVLGAISALNATTKMSMELWNRWTMETIDGKIQQNELAVKRGYFRLEPQFTSNIKGRFNLDFFSDEDGAGDGVGMKLKYAYLDFAVLPIPDSKLTIGLMKTYFGTIYDWDYQTIEKDPSDKYKFVSSTDYGVGISGYYPKGFGTYNVAVYNGEGYKKTADDLNKDMNFAIDTRITPFTGVTIGGSYMFMSKEDSQVDTTLAEDGPLVDNPAREHYNMIAGMGKLAFGDFSLLGQYLMKTKSMPNVDGADDVVTTVLSVMPKYKINNTFDVLGRYDIYDPNTDNDDDAYNVLVLGVNYNVLRNAKNSPTLFFQLNYETKMYENSDKDPVNQIMLQMRWKFSEVLGS